MTQPIRSPDDLRANQRLISRIVEENDAQLVISGMGSGKTGATLDAAVKMLNRLEVNHILVIAPKFVAKNTWPDEVKAWSHTQAISVAVAVGDPITRREAIQRRAEITTINTENLQWLAKFIKSVENWYWDMVVIDESPRFKAGEGRTKATKYKDSKGEVKVREGGNMTRFGVMATARRKIKRIVELTGTPAPKGLIDLWGQAYLLDQGRALGRDKSDFERKWFDKDKYTHVVSPRANAEAEILERLKHLLVTIPQEKVVPDPRFIPMKVTLPEKAMADYREFEKTLYSEPYDIEAVSSGVLANKLMQFANGSLYREDRSVVHIHDEKLEALQELSDSCGDESLLIFYGFKFDKDRIKERFPEAVVANEYRGDLVADWNKGRIKRLLAHPACLRGDTEVLTEMRGWVRIVDVQHDDRVFDGVEFVGHRGCVYSGYKTVVDVFGVKMTIDHQILVGGTWTRASDVGNCEDVREQARYQYAGDDARLGALLALRPSVSHDNTERQEASSTWPEVLPALRDSDGATPRLEQVEDIRCLEWDEGSLLQSKVSGPQELRRPGDTLVRRMGNVRELLRGHGVDVSEGVHHREDRRERRLQQGELHLGDAHGATSQQTDQSRAAVSGSELSPRGAVSFDRIEQVQVAKSTGEGDDCGDGGRACAAVTLRDGETCHRSEDGDYEASGAATKGGEKCHVYDLVDCGPRHRFVIRNADGELFISHNSIGHGTNLQYGGHIACWYGLTFSLELWQQANMRLPRPGQTEQVLIYPIIARGTYDERAIDILQDRESTQDRIISNFVAQMN